VSPSPVGKVASSQRPLLCIGSADPNGDRSAKTGGGKRTKQSFGVTGGNDQLVVLTATESLVVGGAHSHGDDVQSDAHARGVGQVPNIGSQAVRDVDGRGGSGQAGRFSLGQSGHRSSMGLYENVIGSFVRPQWAAGAQDSQSGRRRSERPGYKEGVPHPGTGPPESARTRSARH
jgi:hypothetical protein